MADNLLYVGLAAAAAICVLVLIARHSVDPKSVIATPSISQEAAILSTLTSIKIKASPEDVFAVVASFKDYSTEAAFSEYKWKTADGIPTVGSTGMFKLSVGIYGTRLVPVKITLLDRESKKVSELTTSYPRWLLCSERVQEVVALEGHPGWSEYRVWHTIQGIAGYYLLMTAKGDLSDIQKRDASSLRDYLESGKR